MNIKSKSLVLLLASVCISLPLKAQEQCDTITVLKNASSVILTSDGGKNSEITVEVKASGTRPAYTYKYSSKVTEPGDSTSGHGDNLNLDLPFLRGGNTHDHSMFYSVWFHDIHVGAVIPVDNEASLRTGWEIGIGKVAGIGFQPFYGGPSLEIGVGFLYRCMYLDKSHVFGTDDHGVLYIEPLGEGYTKGESRLDLRSIEIPLSLRQRIYKKFHVEAGVNLNLCISAHATRKYQSADNTRKISQTLKHLHQRNVGMELRLGLGWDDIFGFYVRYSPVSVFKPGYGPHTDFISAGATLAF